jgi:hypothetical protein
MTTHFTTEPLDANGWAPAYCDVDDGGDTATTMGAVTCWECLAGAGVPDAQIERQCGPSDFGGDGPVLRILVDRIA